MEYNTQQIYTEYPMTGFDRFVYWFCIVDGLFLTYLPFVALTVSTPIILLWILQHIRELIDEHEYQICILLAVLMMVSIVWGFLDTPSTLTSNLKVWLIQILCYHYYFMFKYYREKYNYGIDLKKYLIAFLFLGFALAVFYIVNRGGFISLKSVVNRFDGVVGGLGTNYQGFRYNFLWTDANNPAYAFSMVMAFVLLKYRLTLLEKVATVIFPLIAILCSMSTGGLVMYIVSLAVCLIIGVVRTVKNGGMKIYFKEIATILILLLMVYMFYDKIVEFFNNPTIQQSLDRTSSNEDQLTFRMNIWSDILSKDPIWHHVFLGIGPSCVVNGVSRKPHNGILYLVYGYGMIATFLFLKLFFFKKKHVKMDQYVYTMAAWAGLIINGIIGNPKFLIIFFLLAVETRYPIYEPNDQALS